MTIYISGKMTGLPEHNHPAFHAAEAALRQLMPHARIINPARNDIGDTTGMTEAEIWEAYMQISRRQVRDCDIVATLDGWQDSRGACEEVALAEAEGKPVLLVGQLR